MKDKKAFLFYFLMSIIFYDFANQIKKISFLMPNYSNSFFSIEHTKNIGASFGILKNSSFLLGLIALVVVIFLFYYVFKNIEFKNRYELFSLTLFNAGTVGNLIERFKYGYVTDYIKLNFVDFPIFNCFDIMICVGIFIYIVNTIITHKEKPN